MADGSDAQAMQTTWTQAVDKVKQEVISPSLWRALERTVPIAWEDNTFVIGLSAAEGQMAGQLNTAEYRGAIERTLRTLTGSEDLRFRVIEGMTYADWEYTKARDVAAVTQRQQAAQKRYTEAGAFATWDEIYDQVSRLWANSDLRSLPTGKARFLDRALTLLEKAMETLYPTEGQADETTERGLSRVIERIASMSNSDSAFIAYLLFDRRRSGP